MSSTTAEATICVLRHVFARFGLPRQLVLNNGPQFTSSEFQSFLQRNGVDHILTPPYHPNNNGAVEKNVGTVKSCIAKHYYARRHGLKASADMHQIVDDFLLNYRTTPHSSTGRTPAELMLKLQLRTRLSMLKLDPIGTTRVTTAEKLVERKFHTGDTVLLRSFLGGPKWISASVHKQIGPGRYIVETINGKQREAHVDHLLKARAGLTLDKFVIPKDIMPTWRPTQPAPPPPPAHSTYLPPSWDPLLPPPQPPATPTPATIQNSPVDEDIPTLYLYTRKEDGRLEKVGLENTEVEKDIGVYVDKNLNFQEQITNKTNKANQIMGIIRRTFDHLDHKSFSLLYKSLVRPHLEVSNSAWVPHLKKDIELIESVQRRATRQLPGFNLFEYEERLQLLGLPTLTFRRIRGDMIETFKILSGT